MTNQQILTKAIQKAIDGGWDIYAFMDAPGEGTQWYVSDDTSALVLPYGRGGGNAKSPESVIFNHDFAKALWGEEGCPYDVYSNRKEASGTGGPDEDWYDGETWEFHLQQMVIAKDPIKYLGENI